MKRLKFYIISALLSANCLCANAQIAKYYICDGYSYKVVEVEEGTELPTKWEDVDSITFAEPRFPAINIEYSNNTAKVTIPLSASGVTCTSGTSSHVVINSTNTKKEMLYVVSGTSNDGSLLINGEYKLSLHLNGVNLKNPKGAAIDIESGKRIDVFVVDNTENSFEDGANGNQKSAFYSKGHLEFKGAGTLNIKGNTKHALAAKEYLNFKATFTGNLNILGAVSDGIHCGKGDKGDSENNYFQMHGGTINISNCGSDCIDSDDYGCAYIKGGKLIMDITQADGNGLKADSIITMSKGTIEAHVTGNLSEAICCSYKADLKGGKIDVVLDGDGCKGVKSNKSSKGKVQNGGNLNFMGTDVSVIVNGGIYKKDNSKSYGLKADQTLTQTAGNLNVVVNNPEGQAYKATTTNFLGGTRNF